MRKLTGFAALALLAAWIAGIAPAGGNRPAQKVQEKAEEGVEEVKIAPRAVIAYYFHGDYRCQRCLAMQAYTEEALKSAFPKELKEGKLVIRLVNVDREKNAHFIEDYKLVTRSLVISEVKDGKELKWKNLTKIWQCVGDKAVFMKYVQDETGAYLKGLK